MRCQSWSMLAMKKCHLRFNNFLMLEKTAIEQNPKFKMPKWVDDFLTAAIRRYQTLVNAMRELRGKLARDVKFYEEQKPRKPLSLKPERNQIRKEDLEHARAQRDSDKSVKI